jgi:PAS domain S-box-containing protein
MSTGLTNLVFFAKISLQLWGWNHPFLTALFACPIVVSINMDEQFIPPSESIKLTDQKFLSPQRILIVTIISIFLAEIFAMLVVYFLKPTPYWVETLLDASLMVLIILPITYYFSFRTLIAQIDERKRSQALLTQVLETLPVGVWITDETGKVLHGNPAVQEIWAGARYVGMEQYGEYKGWWMESGELIKPEEWAAARAISKGETSLNEEIEIECFDGSHKIILNSAVPILDEVNSVQGVIVVNQDITERKRSELLFKTALEALPVGVWISDETGKITYGNPEGQHIWAGARYVGIEQFGEYKGWWLATGKRIEANEWAVARAIQRGEFSLNEEIEIECFDGTHKIILNSAVPIRNERQHIQGAFIVNQDITSRKQYERQLLATNELLESVFFSIDTHIAYLDRNFNFIRVNDAYARAAQHPTEFFAGKNHFDLYPHAENQAIFQSVVDTGEPYLVFEKPFEYTEFPERGITYWNWSLQPVKGEDGSVQGLVLSLADVTVRKTAEQKLELQNQELIALSEAERKQRQLAEGIAQATLALNESLDMETVLDRIFEIARRIIPFTGANIALVTPDDRLSIVRSWGFEDQPQAHTLLHQTFSVEDFMIIQEIFRTLKPRLIEDTTRDPDWVVLPGLEWVRACVMAPLVQGGQVIGTVSMFGDDTRVFSQEIEDTIMAYAAPAAAAVQNARLFATEQRTRQVAEILRSASLALTQSLDIKVVMERMLEQAQILIPYDVGVVALAGEGHRLTLQAVRGSQAIPAPVELLNHDFISSDYPHIHRVLETHKTFVVPDTAEFPGWTPLLGPYVKNWLGIPLFFAENTLGIFWVIKTKTHFFSEEHASLAEALVSQASVAIQNAWLFDQVRAGHERLQSLSRRLVEVQESERRYIARELHDQTSQALTALKFGLHHLEQDCKSPQALLVHLSELKQLTDDVLEDLHRLAIDLRPASLDHLGLVTALEQLVRTIGDRYHLSMHFKAVGISELDRLPNDVETTMYRIVQEALTNVIRHANASNVDVILELQDGKALVIIEDDGIGFDIHEIQHGHLGILGMEERAQMAGGSLQIESKAGSGTTIVAEVPYDNSYLNRR